MGNKQDEIIGQRVVQLRGQRPQKEIAKLMSDREWKWSQATVWAVEKGDRPLRLAEAVDLAGVLRVSLDDLLGDEETLTDKLVANAYQANSIAVRETFDRALAQAVDIVKRANQSSNEFSHSGYWLDVYSPSNITAAALLEALRSLRDVEGELAEWLRSRWADEYLVMTGFQWESMGG